MGTDICCTIPAKSAKCNRPTEFITYTHTRQRTKYLAQPRYKVKKYSPRPHFRSKIAIEVIREPDISTRLTQLSIRPVRYDKIATLSC